MGRVNGYWAGRYAQVKRAISPSRLLVMNAKLEVSGGRRLRNVGSSRWGIGRATHTEQAAGAGPFRTRPSPPTDVWSK